MSDEIQLPVRFEMKVYVTDGNGIIGTVDIDLPIGRYPTKEKIKEWIENNRLKVLISLLVLSRIYHLCRLSL